jgi:hypothetical protein
MASAAGVAGVRATLDLGSQSSKCVQCGEPDSARITLHPEGDGFARNSPTVLSLPAAHLFKNAKSAALDSRRAHIKVREPHECAIEPIVLFDRQEA